MPQKLRGTTWSRCVCNTYYASELSVIFKCLSVPQSDEGTTGEKLDFKFLLPCSSFLCPVPCAQ